MSSTSSRKPTRHSDRRRDKAVEDGIEHGPEERGAINHPTSYRPSRPARNQRPFVLEFNGDVTIKAINGNVSIGSRNEDQPLKSPLPSVAPRQSSRLARPKTKSRQIAVLEDEDSYEDSEDYSGRSRAPSIAASSRTRLSHAPTDSHDPAWRDEGYVSVTAGSTRSSRSRKGKDDPAYNDISGVPSRESLQERDWLRKKSKKTRTSSPERDSDEDAISDNDTNLANHVAEEDDSDTDDEFNKRTMSIMDSKQQQIEVRVILDTGTGPDWISYDYLTKLGLKAAKLSKDQSKEFNDFNGKPFKASGKVDLSVYSHEFEGFPCRTLPFLVSRESTFKILLGKKTIKAHNLLTRKERESLGDAAHVGLQPKKTKAEQEEIDCRKAEQDKQAAIQERKREERRKEKTKDKQESRTRSAHLAQEVRLPLRRRSEMQKVMEEEKSSSSSDALEGAW